MVQSVIPPVLALWFSVFFRDQGQLQAVAWHMPGGWRWLLPGSSAF